MPLVVVDTSVALPATLSPRGLARKLWVLLAFGALVYREQHFRLDLEALEREAEGVGGTIGGRPAIVSMIELVEERRTMLAELLPHGAPSDWVAAGSSYLFDEYERKVRTVGAKLGREVDEAAAAQLRRQVEAICVTASPPFDAAAAPRLTADRADDPVVYTALRVGADVLPQHGSCGVRPAGSRRPKRSWACQSSGPNSDPGAAETKSPLRSAESPGPYSWSNSR
jgi:hypothetical protein